MRLVLGASLVFLGRYPYIQAGVNGGAVFVYVGFIVAVRPHFEKTQQITAIASELGVLAVFGLVIPFLKENWESTQNYAESIILYIVTGVVLVQTGVAIFGGVYGIYSCMRSHSTKVDSSEENQNSEFEPRRAQIEITEVTSPDKVQNPNDPLEFFRKKKPNNQIPS